MEEINKQIANSEFHNVYLLFGEEGYLKKQYRDKLTYALIDKEDTMNYNYFEGNKINPVEVCDLGDTLPFFSERRVLVIENSGWFKKAPEDIDKRLESFEDTTYIIFVENEVDKRNRLYKWVSKNGYASEMKTPAGSMLVKWVEKQCKAEEKNMEKDTIKYLVTHMGADMLMLHNELNKLFAYCGDRTDITLEDVQEVCISQAVDKLYKMIDAIGEKKQDVALALYHDLLVLREPAMRILFNITNHFKSLMELSVMPDKGYQYKEIASLCGIPEFNVKKNKMQASRYTYEELRSMVELCQLTDQNIKTGRVQDIVGVELLIVEFSK
ncbi:MAG: DNA polymerase III subunit delta [Lachnospiraceae bacterium]